MKNLISVLLTVSVFGAITCAASLIRASASAPNSLTMTCAQVQDHIAQLEQPQQDLVVGDRRPGGGGLAWS